MKETAVAGKGLEKLVKFFPHVGEGRKGGVEGSWGPWVTVVLQTDDGRKLSLKVSWKYEYWNEGNGDWRMKDGFGNLLNEIFPGGEAKAEQ